MSGGHDIFRTPPFKSPQTKSPQYPLHDLYERDGSLYIIEQLVPDVKFTPGDIIHWQVGPNGERMANLWDRRRPMGGIVASPTFNVNEKTYAEILLNGAYPIHS